MKSSLSKGARAQIARDFATHLQNDLAAISHTIDEIAGRSGTPAPTRQSLRTVQSSLAELVSRLESVKEDEVHLTRMEMEVFTLLRTTKSAQEIAADLHLSLPTIKSHIASIYRKFGTSSRSGALAEAKRLGM